MGTVWGPGILHALDSKDHRAGPVIFLALPPPPAPPPPIERPAFHTDTAIALSLFVLSELIGASKLKDHGVLQLILHLGRELFPYQPKTGRATRHNRPGRRRRDEHGRFLPDED